MKNNLLKKLGEIVVIFLLQLALWLIINDFKLNMRYVAISLAISVVVIFAIPRAKSKE
ncbi:MAG: hypothetical protein R2800_14575 [Flavipsychrobacter sp.]